GQPEQRDRAAQETLGKYTRYVNAGLAKLYRFANVMTVEWEASGAVIRDLHGKEYIDCSGGPAVFNVGHRHPKVVAAVREQLDRMPMSVRAMPRKPEADLAELLAQITPGDLQYTFFANSGAEANEGALKLARPGSVISRAPCSSSMRCKRAWDGPAGCSPASTGVWSRIC